MNAFATGHVLAAAKAFFCRNMLHFFIDVVIIKHDVNLLSLNRRFAAFEDMDNTNVHNSTEKIHNRIKKEPRDTRG